MRKRGITGLLYIFNLTLLLWLMGTAVSYGQDVSFSQYYTNPLYLNPAFAGTIGAPRIALQYRNQWQQFDGAYTSYSAAFDAPVKKLQGGLGVYLLNDAQASQMLNSFQLNVAYSVKVRLNEDYFFHGGIQVGYAENTLKTNELVFADNMENNGGIPGSSAEVFTDPKFSYLDYSFGLLIYSKKVFGGLTIHHLTEPDLSFSEDNSYDRKLPRKYSLHAGARLPVFRHGHLHKKFDISPQLILQKQGVSEQVNYGMFATKNGFTGGAWFRQNFGIKYDAVILLVGYTTPWMQLTYSYDWTVSGLAGQTGGTSEISLAFVLNKRRDGGRLPFFVPYEERFGGQ
ncbi:PorP/SprF family type IX secretion system membrane protein [Mangrovibacterium lignilyticum]|uniref:PorP/SprF family type IX secretion system membrane protein n=1 Tax=Mangrovibacterium lignilyticum TaxID=2668052 RepID=UPI0013D63DA8|nr:PorP/SprF family type IX secretion system membrane protein [Mangrovibacterium lignilyticum]